MFNNLNASSPSTLGHYCVALYLIITGLLGLFGGAGSFHLR
jgi:hypothetical protein